jgi:hypothetical protein
LWYHHDIFTGYLCPDLNPTPHLAQPTNWNKYRVHNTVEFRCNAGYILSGSKSAMCRYVQGDNMGSWDNPQPNCTGKFTSIQSIMISFQRKHNIS